MDVVLSGLTVNGVTGYRLARDPQVILLENAESKIALVRSNIHSVAYQRISYPIFLWVMGVCVVFALLATSDPRPAIGEYEIVDWYWWVLMAAVAGVLYAFVKSAAVVVASGTVRTVLKGSDGVMLQAFEALQPQRL